jgi:hypothetical protein
MKVARPSSVPSSRPGAGVADENLINPLQRSSRCTAHSKRTGLPCGAPAVTGWSVCRMHGAGGGAPCGERNGNYRHGGRTKQTMALIATVRDLVRESRELLEAIK